MTQMMVFQASSRCSAIFKEASNKHRTVPSVYGHGNKSVLMVDFDCFFVLTKGLLIGGGLRANSATASMVVLTASAEKMTRVMNFSKHGNKCSSKELLE